MQQLFLTHSPGGAMKSPGRAGWTPEYRAAVVAAYVAGATHRELAAELGVSSASTILWCKQAGASRPDTSGKAVAAYRRGDKIADIAGTLGISTKTVWRLAKKAGLARKGLAPVCHPERPIWAKSLCGPCYRREWERRHRPARKSLVNAA